MSTKSDRNLSPEQSIELARVWPNSIIGDLSIRGPSTVLDVSGSPVINTPFEVKSGSAAVKFDDGKVDWSLVPLESLEGMVRVLEFGAKKYAAWNWTSGGGFKWGRVLSSTCRHLFAFMRGEDNDPESGLSHIYHAQCNLLFLAHYIRNKEKFSNDDRTAR